MCNKSNKKLQSSTNTGNMKVGADFGISFVSFYVFLFPDSKVTTSFSDIFVTRTLVAFIYINQVGSEICRYLIFVGKEGLGFTCSISHLNFNIFLVEDKLVYEA